MSSSVAATHQNRNNRRLADEFRVGSYVVHSPVHQSRHFAAATTTTGSQIPQPSRLAPVELSSSSAAVAPLPLRPRNQLPRAVARPQQQLEMGDRLSTPATTEQLSPARCQQQQQPGAQVTPRLPRGVSRIPHPTQQQDHSRDLRPTDSASAPHDDSLADDSAISCNSSSSKYLTFNKDQATSHFKSLREELNRQPISSGNANHRPSPVERQRIKLLAQKTEPQHQVPTSSTTTTTTCSRPQQPLCEAFIMTGQSMLKLSCNESNSDHQQQRKRNQSSEQLDQVARSTSLNRLHQSSAAQSAENVHSHQLTTTDAHEHEIATQVEGEAPEAAEVSAEVEVKAEQQQQSEAPDAKLEQSVTNNRGQPFIDRNGAIEPTQTMAEAEEPQNESGASATTSLAANTYSGDEQVCSVQPIKLADQSSVAVKAECDTTTATTTQLEANNDNQDELDNQAQSTNDRDSARRLAKRLYNLSGFKRSDVCHHLSKNNPFSKLVADEYLSLFDLRSMKLDAALRKFLSKLQLNGETQERERMLAAFSQRYFDCNREKFPSAEIVQTLVCALVLLNTDLHHSKRRRNKLGLGAFVDGLNSSLTRPSLSLSSPVGLNSSQNGQNHQYAFPRHLLVDLYESVRKRPLKCGDDKCDMSSFEAELDKIYSQQVSSNRSNTLPTRRFAPGSNAPSSTLSANARRHLKQGLDRLNSQHQQQVADEQEAAIEFRSGPLNRKRVFEANGQPTAKGRRSWRRLFVLLRDLRLVFRPISSVKDDDAQKSDKLTAKQVAKRRALSVAQDMKNTVRLHHTFAKRSSSYTKRDYVFHLRLADQSEFLLQANSENELSLWVDTINFASACLSSPALPSAVSSAFKRRKGLNSRPVLPASYTKLSYWEQLIDHEERLQRLKQELDEHLSEAPRTKNAPKRDKTEFIEKIAYLKQEIERYTVYVDLMRKKSNSPEAIILSKHPQIGSLTPSDEMILSLPSFAPPHLVESSAERKSQQVS